MERVPMTSAGYSALENELRHRLQVERPRLIKQLANARTEENDPAENTEYQAALQAHDLNEVRIIEIEDKLARGDLVDVSALSGDTVKFGATVILMDEETGAKESWQIVGEPEADPKRGKISISSPLARSLIGRKAGASVEVITPGGPRTYEVQEIEWPSQAPVKERSAG
jgi:transcription elongation factor GreA